jgi:tetratricopeptide (TPR) repeat protein
MIAQKKLSPERQARRFHLRKRWNKAIEEYQKCLGEDEKNLAIANLLGDALYQRKSVDEAFEVYRKVLTSYEAEGLYDNAIAIAKKMSRLDPQNSGIQLKLAELYTDQEFLADALNHLKNYVQFAGKRIDEKATLGLFQKIAAMTVQNPGLWDQFAEFYRSLNLNDPELNKVMAPENAAARLAKPAERDDLGGTARRARSTDAFGAASRDDQNAHQRGWTELETIPSKGLGEAADDDGKATDELILEMMDTIRKKKDAKPEADKEDEPEDELKLSNILSEVLPPEEQSIEPVAPARSGKSKSKASSPKPRGITLDEVDSLDSLDLVESSHEKTASSDHPLEEEKEIAEKETTDLDLTSPGILDETVTTSELISDHIETDPNQPQSAEEEESGSFLEAATSSTDEAFSGEPAIESKEVETEQPAVATEVRESKPAKVKTKKKQTDVEEAALWTLPYEVAEEATPESSEKEESSDEEIEETQAVESILTGFSADASPETEVKAEAAELTEEIPEGEGKVEMSAEEQEQEIQEPSGALDAETQPEQGVSDEETVELQVPETASDTSDEDEDADSAEEDQNLQSMKLSKIAEINSQKRVVTVSFDGKEHFDMGKIYKEMRLWDAAIAEFKTAATDPNWRAKSCIILSECYREKGDLTLAITQLKWALSTEDELKEEGDKYDLHFELGLIYEKAGNWSEAKDQFQAVHRWNPEYNGVEKKLMELRKRLQKA